MQATSVINSLYDRLDNPEYLTMAQVVQLDGLRLREFVLPQQECWQRLHAHADLLSVLPEVTKPVRVNPDLYRWCFLDLGRVAEDSWKDSPARPSRPGAALGAC